MFLKYLSGIWAAFAPAMGNHVWQSTLFVVVAWLLTLALRKNQAQTRYWLWLAASAKFLVPFSLLVVLGSRLSWWSDTPGAKPGFAFVITQASQPFTQPMAPVVSPATPSTPFTNLTHLLPVLLAVWLCGFLGVLFVWFLRWRRISAATGEARPLRDGREIEALRRLERIGGIRKPTQVLLSRASLEPGIFGIFHPVLVWPEKISARLEDAHLEAILAHELWHVRRRDNLAAAMHMLVEALFWFHPFVWWLGARLVDERERACDEQVLDSGREPQIYAESILKICEFCVEAPLACMSGVTGADLKRRIARIMAGRVNRRLNLGAKLLLAAAALLAVAGPIAIGLLDAKQIRSVSQENATLSTVKPTPVQAGVIPTWQAEAGNAPHFDVAFVKQNKSGAESASMNVPLEPGAVGASTGGLFSGTNISLIGYIYFAYKLTGTQFQLLLPNVPSWLINDRFDIRVQAAGNPSTDQLRLVTQSVLADRFHLAAHYETQKLPVFALVLAQPGKTGPQLQPHASDPPCPAAPQATIAGGISSVCGRIEGKPSTSSGRMGIGGRDVPMELLATTLAQVGGLDRAVLDQTSLGGTYDFTFEWTPRPPAGGRANPRGSEPAPAFLQDLNEQLGLRLEPQTGPVTLLVIDHVEQPSEN